MTTANGPVMFVAAHPDDADFLAGGTVARLAKEGRWRASQVRALQAFDSIAVPA